MFRKATGILWIASALLACSPVRVTNEFGSAADLSGYRTYSQIHMEKEIPAAFDEGPIAGDRVHAEIDRQLQARGYRPGDAEKADVRVSFLANSASEVRLVNAAEPETDHYLPKRFTLDSLVITLFDSATGMPVWRASGEVETMIGGALVSESREQALLRAVREVLAALPPAR